MGISDHSQILRQDESAKRNMFTDTLASPKDEMPSTKTNIGLDLTDPKTYRPRAACINVDLILQQATCAGWMRRHKAPTFSFMKNIKNRYVVLVDRMLYAFKTETPDTYREFFEITKNTHAFVTDQFSGELYCIEIRKTGRDENISSWFLQAENVESMKLWLDNIKRTIGCLQKDKKTVITRSSLSSVVTEDEEYTLIAAAARMAADDSSDSSRSSRSLVFSNISNISGASSSSRPASPILQGSSLDSESNMSLSSGGDYCSSSSYTITTDLNRRRSSLFSSTLTTPLSTRITSRNNSICSNFYMIPNVLPPQLPPPKSLPPPIPSYSN